MCRLFTRLVGFLFSFSCLVPRKFGDDALRVSAKPIFSIQIVPCPSCVDAVPEICPIRAACVDREHVSPHVLALLVPACISWVRSSARLHGL